MPSLAFLAVMGAFHVPDVGDAIRVAQRLQMLLTRWGARARPAWVEEVQGRRRRAVKLKAELATP